MCEKLLVELELFVPHVHRLLQEWVVHCPRGLVGSVQKHCFVQLLALDQEALELHRGPSEHVAP